MSRPSAILENPLLGCLCHCVQKTGKDGPDLGWRRKALGSEQSRHSQIPSVSLQ